MLVKYKSLPKNECCIICNGHTYVFDFKGDCILTDAGLAPKYTTNCIDVSIMSFISLNGVTEVLVSEADKSASYIVTKDISEVILQIMSVGGFIRSLKQKTFIDDFAVTNYLFVFTLKHQNVQLILNNLNAKFKKEYF